MFRMDDREDYRVFRLGLFVYGIAALSVASAILFFVASYIPLLLTGDETNIFSGIFQLIGLVFVVFGIGITGLCAPIVYVLPRDEEKPCGWVIVFACILGASISVFKPPINSLVGFPYASLLIGTLLFLTQFVALSWLLSQIATRFEQHVLARKTKRLVPWLLGTWILPTVLLILTFLVEGETNVDGFAVYFVFSLVLLVAIAITTAITALKVLLTFWQHIELLGDHNTEPQ